MTPDHAVTEHTAAAAGLGLQSVSIRAKRSADRRHVKMECAAHGKIVACQWPFAIDRSPGAKWLLSILSATAGTVDAIGFLGLGGLFTAHITGNLVVLAAHVATGRAAPLAQILAVPMFVVLLGLTRLAAIAWDASHGAPLRPLLMLQFLLLVGFLVACGTHRSNLDPDAPAAVLGGMFGIAAMAVQNALVQISFEGAPATTVMTTNITAFIIDLGAILSGDPVRAAQARARAGLTWPAIVGFSAGCGVGAAAEAVIGLQALVLPTCFALLALGLSVPTAGSKGR